VRKWHLFWTPWRSDSWRLYPSWCFVQQAGLAKLIGLAGETNVQVCPSYTTLSLVLHLNITRVVTERWRRNYISPFLFCPWFLQGEEQKKLDVLSNDVFIKALVSSGRTVGNLIPCSLLYWFKRLHALWIYVWFDSGFSCVGLWLTKTGICPFSQNVLVSEELDDAVFVPESLRGRFVMCLTVSLLSWIWRIS
jgi:hypothetical protein